MQTFRSAIDIPSSSSAIADPDTAARPAPIVCRTVAMAECEADWHRLEALPLNSLHQGYAWCRAWAQAHGREPVIIEGRRAGQTMFLLPLDIIRRNGIRVAGFPGERHNNLNTGLFDEDLVLSPSDLAAIQRQIADLLSDRVDLVVLEGVPARWRGSDHPLATLLRREHLNHSFQLPLLSSFDETLKQVNAKRRRKKFRTQTRRMEEAGGFDHHIPETTAGQHALLDLFFQQKRVRFEAHGLPDVFCDDEIRAFFHRLIDCPGTADTYPLKLHCIRLKADGAIAAIAGLSRKGDHVICQFGSIDETKLSEASPGELLFWLMVEQSCRDGAALFDFGVGDQIYKRSWCPVETVLYDLTIPVSTAGKIAQGIFAAIGTAKSGLKRSPRLYRLLQRLRAGRSSAAAPAEQD